MEIMQFTDLITIINNKSKRIQQLRSFLNTIERKQNYIHRVYTGLWRLICNTTGSIVMPS